VRFQEPKGLFDALMDGKSNVGAPASQGGQGGATTVQINGINVSASDLRELLTPRLMYLWRGQ
jgi:hypothetical protein